MMMIGCVLGSRYEDTLRDLMGRWKILKKRSALGLFIYTFALGIMIWAAVEANTNPGDYEAFIIKRGYFNTIIGIIIGIGFLPVILMILALAIVIICGVIVSSIFLVGVPIYGLISVPFIVYVACISMLLFWFLQMLP